MAKNNNKQSAKQSGEKPAPRQPELQLVHPPKPATLIIALCGAVGSPLRTIDSTLQSLLTGKFGYQECTIIKLSTFIEQQITDRSAWVGKPAVRIHDLIVGGDALRQKHGDDVLAKYAVREISRRRQNVANVRQAFIIDSVKGEAELKLLKRVYGDMLHLVAAHSPIEQRKERLRSEGCSNDDEFAKIVDLDSGEEKLGPKIKDVFPQADFFLILKHDGERTWQQRAEENLERFLHLVHRDQIVTPSVHERAMNSAADAAANSACLSRQVGAALTEKDGTEISVGWNDVPKKGGSLYTAEDKKDDHRCTRWTHLGLTGQCWNDYQKNVIADHVAEAVLDCLPSEVKPILEKHGIGKPQLTSLVKSGKVGDLIEFSRAVHAEMHAIIVGSRKAGARIVDGNLYVTTYPCHNCARHIVAAGIATVYYIEPYKKSMATKLHHDSITEREDEPNKVRFLPFEGVAPSRFSEWFSMIDDSRKKAGKAVALKPVETSPLFTLRDAEVTTREHEVVISLEGQRPSPALPAESVIVAEEPEPKGGSNKSKPNVRRRNRIPLAGSAG